MKKIALVALVAAGLTGLAIWGTNAYFSDTEASTGNVLEAGAIDLMLDNTSYYNGVAQPTTTWNIRDLTVEKFFNFSDLKPGDEGEDTISLHVNSNDAWACARITLTSNNENALLDPEIEAGDTTSGAFQGELAQNLHFVWWPDDGDNVLEEDEALLIDSPMYDTLYNILQWKYPGTLVPEKWSVDLTLADSMHNFWTKAAASPLDTTQMYYIGKAWCFGTLTLHPVTEGAGVNPGVDSGVLCNGTSAGNMAQSDTLTADLEFTAVQYRNNENYLCPEHL